MASDRGKTVVLRRVSIFSCDEQLTQRAEGENVSEILMIVCVLGVWVGGAISGWYAHKLHILQQKGNSDERD